MIKSLRVLPFTSPFDFHIWVGISKDSENRKLEEPENCRENISMLFQGENLYILLQEENESS